jgi:hypothetical protein
MPDDNNPKETPDDEIRSDRIVSHRSGFLMILPKNPYQGSEGSKRPSRETLASYGNRRSQYLGDEVFAFVTGEGIREDTRLDRKQLDYLAMDVPPEGIKASDMDEDTRRWFEKDFEPAGLVERCDDQHGGKKAYMLAVEPGVTILTIYTGRPSPGQVQLSPFLDESPSTPRATPDYIKLLRDLRPPMIDKIEGYAETSSGATPNYTDPTETHENSILHIISGSRRSKEPIDFTKFEKPSEGAVPTPITHRSVTTPSEKILDLQAHIAAYHHDILRGKIRTFKLYAPTESPVQPETPEDPQENPPQQPEE